MHLQNKRQVLTSLIKTIKGHWQLRALYVDVVKSALFLFWLKTKCLISGRKLTVIALYEHIGDIIACEPVIRYCKTEAKNNYVIWAINANYAELLGSHPTLDSTLKLTSFSHWIFLKKITNNISFADQLIDLHIDERRCSKYGYKLKKKERLPHLSYFTSKSLLQAFCISAGLPELTDAPVFYRNGRNPKLVLPARYIVLHTQTNSVLKDWQPEQWNKFSHYLINVGYAVVEVGLNKQITGINSGYIGFTGRQSLQEVATIIKGSSYFIGLDSGFAHMANALGIPGKVLIAHYNSGQFVFKNYNPFTGNYSLPGTIIYSKDGLLTELTAEEVFDEVEKELHLEKAIHQKAEYNF